MLRLEFNARDGRLRNRVRNELRVYGKALWIWDLANPHQVRFGVRSKSSGFLAERGIAFRCSGKAYSYCLEILPGLDMDVFLVSVAATQPCLSPSHLFQIFPFC